jgi:hypothetical protein
VKSISAPDSGAEQVVRNRELLKDAEIPNRRNGRILESLSAATQAFVPTMKLKRTLLFLVGSLILIPVAGALPPVQHFARGTISAIDNTKIVLALTNDGKDTPTTFTIKAGRTRFREDGKKASLETLKVGQSVWLYYRKEMGVWVATEVAWMASPPPETVFSSR